LAKGEVSLGGELGIGPYDHSSGDAKVLSEDSRRRQLCAGRKRLGLDGAPHLFLELARQGPRAGAVDEEENFARLKVPRAHAAAGMDPTTCPFFGER
jgi:hypothetical protein